MSKHVFYQTKLVLAPIPNQRGRKTQHYIISVSTHDSKGKPYDKLKGRAEEAFNLAIGKGVDDPVNLTEIKEEDVPKEKEQILTRYDGAVFLVKNK